MKKIGNIAKGGEFVDVAEVERCKNRLYTEYMRYRISDYSEKNWGKITDIYSASIFKLENIKMEIELITPIAIEEGLRFAIREGGKTVGSGVVASIIE